ncbi:FMN-dependent NADH-azoreductase [Nereida sp.]|uniref:FMN-dependent NADH-azoreductase n=1 Tax=Nereida sp. TaxID=2736090 RepID=UPI003F69ADD8
MPSNILRLDTSSNTVSASSRMLVDAVVAKLGGTVATRDLAATPPALVDLGFVTGRSLPKADRSAEQAASLELSDTLIAELEAADAIVIGMPIYNFAPPAALKAWADQVAVPRRTFSYSADGPKGLLEGKKAYVVVTSGGTQVDSPIDFATPWLRFFLGFIGITDVTVIAADRLGADAEAKLAEAKEQIAALS